MTDTVYADKLISRLSVFNFVNSYFSLFFTIFSTAGPSATRGRKQGPCRMGAYHASAGPGYFVSDADLRAEHH